MRKLYYPYIRSVYRNHIIVTFIIVFIASVTSIFRIYVESKISYNFKEDTYKTEIPKDKNVSGLLLSLQAGQKLDANLLTVENWIELGFTDSQAKSIVKYKQSLGGLFKDFTQFSKSYVLTSQKKAELQPLLEFGLQRGNVEGNSNNEVLVLPEKFNPNTFTERDWIKAGLNSGQVAAIFKFKNALGGQFPNESLFLKNYVLTDGQKLQLAKHIVIPSNTNGNYKASENKNKVEIHHKFNPNGYKLDDWVAIGFSEKQAQGILNCKNLYFKGNFSTVSDLQKCYSIGKENFDAIRNFVLLPIEKNCQKQTGAVGKIVSMQNLTINTINQEQLVQFGFPAFMAAKIVGFRKILGGFVTPQQVLETYDVDPILVQKLLDKVRFDSEAAFKYTLYTAPEEWLKKHPYFKYNADKILYWRQFEKDQEKLIKKLRLKPEYEKKMRLYLKS